MRVFVCAATDVGFDECWNCSGPQYTIKAALGHPLKDANGKGRYCSQECADEASDRNLTGRACATCGQREGHCSTTHPEDPHVFIPEGGSYVEFVAASLAALAADS